MRTRVAGLATLLLCPFFTGASAGTDAAAGSGRSCYGQGLRVGAARFRIVHLRAGGPIHVGQAGRGELVRCMLALGGCPESTPPRQPHVDCVVEEETRTGAQVPLERLKGIAPRVALGDRSQRQVLYVEGDSCAAARGDAALLRCLRSLEEPPPSPGAHPPEAYAIMGSRIVELAQGSYCWSSELAALCADMIAPWQRGDIPRLMLAPGQLVRFRLGFQPGELQLALVTRAGPVHSFQLPPQATTDWQVPLLPAGAGPFYLSLFARAASAPGQPSRGDADYLARVE